MLFENVFLIFNADDIRHKLRTRMNFTKSHSFNVHLLSWSIGYTVVGFIVACIIVLSLHLYNFERLFTGMIKGSRGLGLLSQLLMGVTVSSGDLALLVSSDPFMHYADKMISL